MVDEPSDPSDGGEPPPEIDGIADPSEPSDDKSSWRTILPIVLSIVAFCFSIGTWYYGSVEDRPSLVAIPDGLEIEMIENVLASDAYHGEVTMSLFLVNQGNRPSAILGAGLALRPQLSHGKQASDIQCPLGGNSESAHATPENSIGKELVARPAIIFGASLTPATPVIEPGKIVKLDLKFNVRFGWDEMDNNRWVEACVRMRVLNSRGAIVARSFPAALMWFSPPSDRHLFQDSTRSICHKNSFDERCRITKLF
jgi:hypothetical protein